VALDPIISLAVAIAESPGSMAFLLGSGVSRDAGVPTGGEVYWNAVRDLYRLERSVPDTPPDEELESWLNETNRDHLGYSGILELIAPQPEDRRAYLAKYFGGREPGPAHEALAEFAARGLARVFVTTNFDRLLEAALRARGVEPVVISTAADLEVAPAREHSRCYLLKIHGDYLQQTIRNTSEELADLEPSMASELQEVFDRYGLVVLGYSGSDPAIARALRSRRSRYGLYWVAREALGFDAMVSLEASRGRVVRRPGANEFLSDLERRVTVFESHPSGQTPTTVYDEVVLLLRRGDRVGVQELLRTQRLPLLERVRELSAERVNAHVDDAAQVHADLRPLMERRFAALLPLVRYAPELLEEEIGALAHLVEAPGGGGGFTFWLRLGTWPVWWVGQMLGAVAVRERAWRSLGAILRAETYDRHRRVPLVQSFAPDTGHEIGVALADGTRYYAPSWMVLRKELPTR
jgi:hypothetical protein